MDFTILKKLRKTLKDVGRNIDVVTRRLSNEELLTICENVMPSDQGLLYNIVLYYFI